MSEQLFLAYHEAAHIVVGWVVGVPVGRVVVDTRGHGVQMRRWYQWTRQWRTINQETVRRDIIWSLAGDYGELLVAPISREANGVDHLWLETLARRFALDLEILNEETRRIIETQREAIARIAGVLLNKKSLSEYETAILHMNWLARGRR